MTKEEILIYEIIGPGTHKIAGFACAVREAKKLLFGESVSMENIHVTLDIYPTVAKVINRNAKTTARQIQRMGNLCWDCLDKKQKMKYIGRVFNDIHSPSDMIFYLAYYSQFEKPYYLVLNEVPEQGPDVE